MLRIPYAPLTWQDQVPVHDRFQDHYFSRDGGLAETRYVFLASNDLPRAWQNRARYVIGETGFGTGLNFLATVDCWLKNSAPHQILYYFSLDQYAMRAEDMQRAIACWPELNALGDELCKNYPEPVRGLHRRELFGGKVILTLAFGDVVEVLNQLEASMDVWYLDGFAPGKNPSMWQNEVFCRLAQLSHPGTRLATFTVAGSVRRGLQAAGFAVEKIPGFGRKREMLRGEYRGGIEQAFLAPWYQMPQSALDAQPVLVIGGGIAGVSTAFQLVRRGLRVLLLERHRRLASEASGNPAGLVYPRMSLDCKLDGQFNLLSYLYTRQLLGQMKEHDGELPWHPTGVRHLMTAARRKRLLELDLPPGILGRSEVSDADAGVGLDYPGAGWVEPERLCNWLAERAGADLQVVTNAEVMTLESDDAGWRAQLEDGRTYRAKVVVVANAHAATSLRPLAALPLLTSRGQISLVKTHSLAEQLPQPLCAKGYLVPMSTAQICVGASYDRENLSLEVRDEDHERNLTILKTLLPQAEPLTQDHIINGRAGLRTTTADHLPLVGPVPDWNWYRQQYQAIRHGKPAGCFAPAQYQGGLYVSLAHGSRGLTTSLPAAALLADMICGTPAVFPRDVIHALHVARYLIRGLKQGTLLE